jgi:hypothetical protein
MNYSLNISEFEFKANLRIPDLEGTTWHVTLHFGHSHRDNLMVELILPSLASHAFFRDIDV